MKRRAFLAMMALAPSTAIARIPPLAAIPAPRVSIVPPAPVPGTAPVGAHFGGLHARAYLVPECWKAALAKELDALHAHQAQQRRGDLASRVKGRPRYL